MSGVVNTFVIPIIRGDMIGGCLETLHKFNEPGTYNVFVIDQTGSKETQEKYEHLSHLWVRPYRNLGFSKAMNTGARLAQTPYITFLNDDIEFVNKKWWQGILDTFTMSEEIIIVNPMCPKEPTWGYGLREDNYNEWNPPSEFVLAPDGDKHYMYPVKPDGKPFTYEDLKTEEGYDWIVSNHPRYRKDTMIDGAAGWCLVAKTSGLQEIGLYDEKFYPGGGEDYDLCARAYSCAWPEERDECDPKFHRRVVSTTKSYMWHHWGKSKDDVSAKDPTNPIFSRPRWNALEELWPNGFDIWSHGHKDVNGQDTKFPFKRIPEIYVEDL